MNNRISEGAAYIHHCVLFASRPEVYKVCFPKAWSFMHINWSK